MKIYVLLLSLSVSCLKPLWNHIVACVPALAIDKMIALQDLDA